MLKNSLRRNYLLKKPQLKQKLRLRRRDKEKLKKRRKPLRKIRKEKGRALKRNLLNRPRVK
jgi:hypothetical protein